MKEILSKNVLVSGMSGAEKAEFIKSYLMNCNSSYICIDPKGELLQNSAGFLESKGYQIKVLNLLNEDEIKKNTHYNPFKYLRNDADVLNLVANFMLSTKQPGESNDVFFEQSITIFLNALVFYTWHEGIEIDGVLHKDFKGVIHLLRKGIDELDEIFNELKEKETRLKEADPTRKEHPALIYYTKVRSQVPRVIAMEIGLKLHKRMRCLENETILELLSEDGMDIESIGERKTVIYCVIPDNDKTFYFLINMLYGQMLRVLYYQAEFMHIGRLPVHVTFMLDANVGFQDNFCSILSTSCSREISFCVFIQDMAQIKSVFKESWTTIHENCDTFVCLKRKNNGCKTCEYISKIRGNWKSPGSNFGVGKCMVFIRGKDPIFCSKADIKNHLNWK